jgi:hypothetical protein
VRWAPLVSHHVMSHRVASCHVMSCRGVAWRGVRYRTVSCRTVSPGQGLQVNREPLLVMNVELENGVTGVIRIFESDRPEDLAATFISQMRLDGDTVLQSGASLYATLVDLIRTYRVLSDRSLPSL